MRHLTARYVESGFLSLRRNDTKSITLGTTPNIWRLHWNTARRVSLFLGVLTLQRATGSKKKYNSPYSLPCSPLFPLARWSVLLRNRKEKKTTKYPHFAVDIWPFFCLCLLYIPEASVPPNYLLLFNSASLRQSTLYSNAPLPIWTVKIKQDWPQIKAQISINREISRTLVCLRQ